MSRDAHVAQEGHAGRHGSTGPGAGAVAFVGTAQTITWTDNLPADATMLIELSRDGGNSFETVAAAAPNTGSFAWTATGPAAPAALVRVTGNEPVPTSGLGGAFTIVMPTLTVISPGTGASWATGTAQAIPGRPICRPPGPSRST